MNPVTKAVHLVTHLGPRWIGFRSRYALRKKSGALLRGSPRGDWGAGAPPGGLFYQTQFQRTPQIGRGCVAEADDILAGSFRLFGFHKVAAGFPPRWSLNQMGGQDVAGDAHWSQLADFAFGDIKGVWELSRFPWAFPLGRAYAATGEGRYAEGFWQLFESWCAAAQPNCGPNWMCGQEATFRLMAATFASNTLASASAITSERFRLYVSFVYATGRRIAANLEYALSQSNNHGISECIGLITAGVILGGDDEAATWRATGLRALESQIDALVYPDGGFAQHSATYHRVLLQDLLWCESLLRTTQRPVPPWLMEAGRRATSFLAALLTPATGHVPLYGANDGANILPLADADYLDFRPAVQAGAAVFFGERWLPTGPWDEAVGWLIGGWPLELSDANYLLSGNAHFGSSVIKGSRAAINAEQIAHTDNQRSENSARTRYFPEAGCFVWRRGEARLFLRCPTRFRHRPSQADLLHADIEWRGERIAHDAGTYSYNAKGQFAGAFKAAAVHNTVTFDGREPMQKVGRFLYLPWPRGSAGWLANETTFFATHDGWRKLGISHTRRISSPSAGCFTVQDSIVARCSHGARVHWLLGDYRHDFDAAARKITLRTPGGDYAVTWSQGDATLVRADPKSDRGWWSPYYHHVVPALSLAIEFDFMGSTEMTTSFAPIRE